MLLTNSTDVLVAAPQPRSSFILCFDPLLDTLSGWGVHSGDQSLCDGVRFLATVAPLQPVQQDDLSTSWPSFLTAVLLCLPVTPRAEISLHIDCAGNPLQPSPQWKVPYFPI